MSNGLIHDATELRKLISQNPKLPIVVLASEDVNHGEWGWEYCNDVSCTIKEILDVKTPFDRDDGIIFDDKDDFEEAIADNFCDLEPYKSMPDDEFQKALDREKAKYADEWKKVIAVYVGN